MKRHSVFMVMGLVLLVGDPAVAQYQPKKKVVQLEVSDYSPKQGQVGTMVTIRGRGFSNRTQVLFGGRPVRPARVNARQLEFVVPKNYRDGSIVLRHPGVARDVVVGNFDIVETARITGFSPRSGVPGTRLDIRGEGFERGDKVMLGSVELQVQRVAPKRIVAVVPRGARTDYLALVRGREAQFRTRDKFEVSSPAPVITRLEPAAGPPGAMVRIWGENFTSRDSAFYGRIPLKVKARGNGWLDVEIPRRARRGDWLSVRGPNGQARSPQQYELQNPPVVTRIKPTYGATGQRVTIYGRNFRPGDRVQLGRAWLEVLQIRGNQITVRIPERAQSGPMVVTRGSLQTRSPQNFDVLYSPAITSFSPTSARAGARVAISGQYFGADAQVYYGRTKLPIRSRKGDHTLVVDLPRNDKQSRKFRIRTRGGEAISAQKFQVEVYAAVTNARPNQGFPGTRVTLTGRDLGFAEEFLLGDTPLKLVSGGPTRAVVEIPKGAQDGVISVRSFGKVYRTKHRFRVFAGPEITAYSPQSARPGMELTIEGQNFDRTTTVYYGKQPLRVVKRNRGQLVVSLPRNLRPGRAHLRVRNGLAEFRSPNEFQILPPASINEVRPDRVPAGATVAIIGEHFDQSCRIYWGNIELPVVDRDRGRRQIKVQIPKDAVGARWLSVDDGGGRHRSRVKLEVYSQPPRGANRPDRRKVKVRDRRKN